MTKVKEVKPTEEERLLLEVDTALTLEEVREYLQSKRDEEKRLKAQDRLGDEE